MADEAIYLSAQYNTPKQHFIDACALWESSSKKEFPNTILDVGSANGSFLGYCKSKYPNAKLVGLDSVEALVEMTASNVPTARTFLADINSPDCDLGKTKFDFIHMAGVLCIFDDPHQAIKNCLSNLAKDGHMILFGSFNRDPIDMLMRYRHSQDHNYGIWQSGWNVFSRNTIEKVVRDSGIPASINWSDFVLETKLDKTNDCMRAWTDKLESGRQVHLNGAQQLLDMQFAIISRADD